MNLLVIILLIIAMFWLIYLGSKQLGYMVQISIKIHCSEKEGDIIAQRHYVKQNFKHFVVGMIIVLILSGILSLLIKMLFFNYIIDFHRIF